MYLSKIKIKNFKSFSNVSVNLRDFNVFVGESASGKSNFIESLMFLKNLSLNSLQAINNHGGFFIQNLKHESNSPTCIRAVLIDNEYNICLNYPISENNMANIYFKSIDYEICINYNKNTWILFVNLLSLILKFMINHIQILPYCLKIH